MPDSNFWAEIAERFRRLQPPRPLPGEVHRASHNGLCAWWKPEGWSPGKPYKFFDDGHDRKSNRNIERLFRIAAERAEIEMGHSAGETAVFAWLDRLRLWGLYVQPFVEGSRIMHRICDASAEYCVKCEGEAKAAARGTEPALSRKKRGRPQTIADDKKVAALALKKSGGSNKEAAVLLYGTRYPTPQQTKNVPAILRHHEQKSKRSDLTAKPRKVSPRVHKPRRLKKS